MLTRDVGAVSGAAVFDASDLDSGAGVGAGIAAAATTADDGVLLTGGATELELGALLAGAGAVGGGACFTGSAAKRTPALSDSATVVGGDATRTECVVSTAGALVVSAAIGATVGATVDGALPK